jgi:hypothetical protein
VPGLVVEIHVCSKTSLVTPGDLMKLTHDNATGMHRIWEQERVKASTKILVFRRHNCHVSSTFVRPLNQRWQLLHQMWLQDAAM